MPNVPVQCASILGKVFGMDRLPRRCEPSFPGALAKCLPKQDPRVQPVLAALFEDAEKEVRVLMRADHDAGRGRAE